MNRYKISQRADQDLEDIWVYVAQNDEIAADTLIAEILNKFPMLAQFPEMGRKRDELLKGLRSFPVKPYIVFYRRTPKGVEILSVLHQSRNIDRQF
ncbi:MAG: type II toxin-antitoxin system RelE/ParE family toxin [Cyanobacteria bacterium CRU_2_1]|nr:type II toxin-antitoxin system RelE/ParE family toxin [Cyanobacteria bacterium RU_5_0]NJR59812.1 type II toxin-antitoxin system RelE/ParE family toxin [Cyanobacteria bacterium CRU_2_1]